jgi:hypothetical protein
MKAQWYPFEVWLGYLSWLLYLPKLAVLKLKTEKYHSNGRMSSNIENDDLVGLQNDGEFTFEGKSYHRTWIMSSPSKLGLPISSPIPACLLPDQPWQRGLS